MIKTIVFDLDGTLLDTLDDLRAATNVALCEVGRAELDVSAVRRFVGNGVPKLIERALEATCGDKAENARLFPRVLDAFTTYYNVHGADRTRPYAGIPELLCELKNRGIKTAIVTNKYYEAARALKEKFFESVDEIIGTKDGIRPKPYADGIEYVIEKLGVDKSDAIYVGDGETDMEAAKNAGLKSVAVTWGFRDREALVALNPDHIIETPESLLRVCDRS